MGKIDFKNKKGGRTLLILAGFGALAYLRNRLIPMFADDYAFSFIWDGKHHGNLAFGKQQYYRVKKAKDLIRSQVSHYLTWSGRTVGESLNQLFLMFNNKRYYDFANTAVTVSQLLLSDWIGSGRLRLKSIPDSLMKALAAGFWTGTPKLAFTTLWQTGAMNYSWPGVLQSVFLLPYSLATKDRNIRVPIPAAVLSGIRAGWSNEAGGMAACFLSGLKYFTDVRRKEDRDWEKYGFISACMGYALLMLAPGNFKRYQVEKEFSDILPEDFNKSGSVPPEYVYKREMFLHFFKSSFLTVILRLLPMQIPVIYCLLKGKERERRDNERLLALEAASLMIPSVLMFSPEFPPHAAYPSVIYAMAAMSGAWEYMDHDALGEKYGKQFKAAKILGALYLAVNIFAFVMVDADWGKQIRKAEELMKENRGRDVVKVPQGEVSAFWSAIAGDRAIDRETHEIGRYEENPEDPYNKAAAAYYGVGKVIAVPGDKNRD